MWELEGQLVKSYRITAPGRNLDPALTRQARDLARAQLAVDRLAGGLGLAVAVLHAGGDGDYVVLQSWIEGYMSHLALFSGPAGQPEPVRPARTGLAPCVWESPSSPTNATHSSATCSAPQTRLRPCRSG